MVNLQLINNIENYRQNEYFTHALPRFFEELIPMLWPEYKHPEIRRPANPGVFNTVYDRENDGYKRLKYYSEMERPIQSA